MLALWVFGRDLSVFVNKAWTPRNRWGVTRRVRCSTEVTMGDDSCVRCPVHLSALIVVHSTSRCQLPPCSLDWFVVWLGGGGGVVCLPSCPSHTAAHTWLTVMTRCLNAALRVRLLECFIPKYTFEELVVESSSSFRHCISQGHTVLVTPWHVSDSLSSPLTVVVKKYPKVTLE